MRGEFARLVRRYGRAVVLREGEAEREGMAFLQPMRDREERMLPTRLGRREQGRTLCLGEPGLGLEQAGEEARLVCGEERFRILTARTVYLGEGSLFCWAVLLPDDEEGSA